MPLRSMIKLIIDHRVAAYLDFFAIYSDGTATGELSKMQIVAFYLAKSLHLHLAQKNYLIIFTKII